MLNPSTPHILIVDDDQQIASSISNYLTDYGFHCESARTAVEFKRKLKQMAPALCIVDLGLPDGDGKDLLQWAWILSGK